MEAAAGRAGASIGTAYRYFANRVDLADAVLERATTPFGTRLAAALDRDCTVNGCFYVCQAAAGSGSWVVR